MLRRSMTLETISDHGQKTHCRPQRPNGSSLLVAQSLDHVHLRSPLWRLSGSEPLSSLEPRRGEGETLPIIIPFSGC